MPGKTTPSQPDYYAYRPNSYWDDGDPLAAILRHVKGTNRRQMIIDYWNAGKIDELDPKLLDDQTEPGVRTFLERLHPSFMGGEYLPDFLPTEVEIARIELKSTTSDVISIRARKLPGDDSIHYRIVDEYDTEFEFHPETSRLPLTQGEMIELIDCADNGHFGGGLALCYNNFNLGGCDAESLRHFTTLSSPFYPQLFKHYDAVHEEWCEANGQYPADIESE